MELKILSAIDEYTKAKPLRFHTPGHKGLLDGSDITEIDDTFPANSVLEAERSAAEFFGSKHCRFLVGGSSMGMKAAIMAVGGDILAPYDRHSCVDEGAKLAGVKLFEYFLGQENGLQRRPTADDMDRYLNLYPSVKAVVLLSPDYYGRVCDTAVAERIKQRGKILIADSAHGAHFPASKLFPSSYSKIADFCNLSGHKTLPCYTQSAYLTVNNDEYLDRVDEALKLLGTTSPSYLLLGSLEYGVEFAKEKAEHYATLKNKIDEIKAAVPTLDNDDITRLVVDTGSKRQGKELYFLLKEMGVVAEKYDDRFVIFIITVCDGMASLDKLKETLICAVNSLQ